MPRRTAPEVEHQILGFLDISMTPRSIISHFKKKGIKITNSVISKIKKRKENPPKIKPKTSKRGNRSALTETQFQELKKMVTKPNPPVQTALAKRFIVSQPTISYQINKVMKLKKVKKPKGQVLTPAAIEKRRKRSWPMYLRLRGQRWKKVVTTDEAWFYLVNKDRKTRVQYISRDQNRSVCETFTHESYPKGVMVWMGISANGCTKVRFVKSGAKVNSNYYIKNILQPFLKEDAPILYPNGDYLFQQDSAPSHRSKKTIKFLNDNKVPFITPLQWLPNSPDAAPLDFFFWGYLKWRINQRKPKTLKGLKRIIKEEVKKVPQNMIDKALKSWSRRCRQIYYNQGLHIEKHN
jgi:hypothetical protein